VRSLNLLHHLRVAAPLAARSVVAPRNLKVVGIWLDFQDLRDGGEELDVRAPWWCGRDAPAFTTRRTSYGSSDAAAPQLTMCCRRCTTHGARSDCCNKRGCAATRIVGAATLNVCIVAALRTETPLHPAPQKGRARCAGRAVGDDLTRGV
jgi:hypothetical protein